MIYDNEVIIQMIRDHFKLKSKNSDYGSSGTGWDSYLIEIESVHDKWGILERDNELCILYNIIINNKSSHVVNIKKDLYLINLSNKVARVRNDKLGRLGI